MDSTDVLEPQTIRDGLDPAVATALDSLEVLDVVASTNDYLRDVGSPVAGRLQVALAEYQTGGRGRHGRRWLSPAGHGVCMSVAWTFPAMPPTLPALSLAAGVAVRRALSAWAPPAVLGLKWPNDILAGGAKLGGLLIDVQGETDGRIPVVVGIGVNIAPVGDLATRFDNAESLPPVGLQSVVGDRAVSRNAVAAAFVNELFAALLKFQSSGFSTFANDWRRYDAMKGSSVRVRVGAGTFDGVATGISDDGALLFEDGSGVRSLLAGEVTLRPTRVEPSR